MRLTRLSTLLLTASGLSACGILSADFDQTLASDVLYNDLLCPATIDKPALQWLDNNTALEQYLSAFSYAERAALSGLDFDKIGVLAVAMGPQSSTGYRLNLITQNGVRFNGSTIRANIVWEEPDADNSEAKVTTNPCLLLSIERVNFSRIELADQNAHIRLETRP